MELEIDELRKVRSSAKRLSSSIMEDLSPFIHNRDERTFVRLPDSVHELNDVGVTVTCSCLMGLALTGNLKDFREQSPHKDWDAKASFKLVVDTPIWSSSGLLRMNAFTSTLVLRAFGFLVEKGELTSGDELTWVHTGEQQIRNAKGEAVPSSAKREWTLLEVFAELSKSAPSKLAVEKYTTSAALLYWFLDAIQRGKLNSHFQKAFWNDVASWAAKEFWKQESLVVAENDTLIDPVAMAMAACVCKKLKHLAEINKSTSNAEYLDLLPSEAEWNSVSNFFFLSKQALASGRSTFLCFIIPM